MVFKTFTFFKSLGSVRHGNNLSPSVDEWIKKKGTYYIHIHVI